MNPLDLVMDLLWELLTPIKNAFIRNFLKIVLMIALLVVYLFLFTKIAGVVSLFVKNRYVVFIIDVLLLAVVAAGLYFLLFLISRAIKR